MARVEGRLYPSPLLAAPTPRRTLGPVSVSRINFFAAPAPRRIPSRSDPTSAGGTSTGPPDARHFATAGQRRGVRREAKSEQLVQQTALESTS